jgi:hypothetical protein
LEESGQGSTRISDILEILSDEKSMAIFEIIATATEEHSGIDDETIMKCVNHPEDLVKF